MSVDPVDPVELRAVAEQLAAEAAEFVRQRRAEVFADDRATRDAGSSALVRAKSSPTDPVTVVDTETERLLRDRLARLRPGDPVLGEEEGHSGAPGRGRPTWVLDPIDGTVNFMYGIEAYAVSVGVQVDGESVAGAVADVAAEAVYSAARGQGARLRRTGTVRRLRCSDARDLSMALIGTGFAYSAELRRRQAQVLAAVLPQVRDVRRIGSCALDLCMVAAGLLDGYYEDGVQVWDWAAGALIAVEAGARVRVPAPGGGTVISAAAPGIDAALQDVLAAATG